MQEAAVLAKDRVSDPLTGVTATYTRLGAPAVPATNGDSPITKADEATPSAGLRSTDPNLQDANTQILRRQASASLLIGASETELSDNGYKNCRFASNEEMNVLYCDGGKIIVQDAIQEDDVHHYLLPRKVRDTIGSINAQRFKFFKSENSPRLFYV